MLRGCVSRSPALGYPPHFYHIDVLHLSFYSVACHEEVDGEVYPTQRSLTIYLQSYTVP
jgi:hypothetical protein